MHSFTPVFKGKSRAVQVGVLYNRDSRLAAHHCWRCCAPRAICGRRQPPYAVGDFTDYSVVNHAERRGIPHVEIEIRQDLIAR